MVRPAPEHFNYLFEETVMKSIVWTVVITLLVGVAIPLLILASGVINMAASNQPSGLEKTLATFAVQRSMAMRAPESTSESLSEPATLSDGLEHYAAMCVRCHGGPGVEAAEFTLGLNPPAPMLDDASTHFTDGELFWIVKNGIRMTGMPAFGGTHSDEDVWKMVAAVNHLSDLSPEQKEKLGEGRAESRHSHGSDAGQSKAESGHHYEGAAVEE